MPGKLAHLGYKRVPTTRGFRWYRDGKPVKTDTVERAKRAVDAAAARAVALAAAERAARAAERAAAAAKAARSRAKPRRPGAPPLVEPAPPPLTAADRRAKTQPIQVRDSFGRWRDARGRYVAARTAARLTAAQRKTRGIRQEQFIKTRRGSVGPRVQPLMDAIREMADRGLTWDRVPDHYYRRAKSLALTVDEPSDSLAPVRPVFALMGRAALLKEGEDLELEKDELAELSLDDLRATVAEAWNDANGYGAP